MSMEQKIRILCVDDHAEIRKLFELMISEHAEFHTVGSLESAEGLEESIERLLPDVVVLDLSMPGRRPLEALRSAGKRFPSVRFLVSSAYDDPAIIEETVRAGANGFLVKEGVFDQLADAIRKVAANEAVFPPAFRRPLANTSLLSQPPANQQAR